MNYPINKTNIKAYIQFLYREKYYTDAPENLITKWASLDDVEISNNLNQLYSHWGYTADKIKETEFHFLQLNLVNPKPIITPLSPTHKESTPATNAVSDTNIVVKKSSTARRIFFIFIPFVILGLAYLFYQYSKYEMLHTVYTLTQNVAIRNEGGKTIGTFALIPSNKPDTYTELIALDNEIYPLAIDSTSQKYDFRKVLFSNIDFIDFLKGNYSYGYVNANYIIEDKQQFEDYKRIFSKFSNVDNLRLKLTQRKIIYNVLKNSRQYRNSYILSSCNNTSKRFAGFISNEIIENTRFQMIAKLEDGYFYSLIGDLNSGEFARPTRLQLDGEDCNSELLFRYINPQTGFKIYNCAGTALKIKCITDESKLITSFETIQTQSNPDSFTEEIESLLDSIFE